MRLSTKDRRRILRRDRWTCQACGVRDPSGASLEVHHLVARARRGPNLGWNLATLCRACHRLETDALIAQIAAERRLLGVKPREPHPGVKEKE